MFKYLLCLTTAVTIIMQSFFAVAATNIGDDGNSVISVASDLIDNGKGISYMPIEMY